MFNVFLLRNITYHVLLFGTGIFFMMMLMMYYLDKHIYDIMLIFLASFLWNKLNMNLPRFLTTEYRHPAFRVRTTVAQVISSEKV